MKYAVIATSFAPPRVLSSHRLEVVAHLALFFWGLRGWSSSQIVEVDNSPATVIAICEHRDHTIARLEMAVDILHNLVSRNDDGHWTTVHDADTMLATQTEISALLA